MNRPVVSNSTPGRDNKEVKAVLGELPFLPFWSFLVLITCFLYALCKRFFQKQSSLEGGTWRRLKNM